MRGLSSLWFFKWTVGSSERWGLCAVEKHQWVPGTSLYYVHPKGCNVVLLLVFLPLIVIITLLLNKIIEAIVAHNVFIIIININFVFDYVHLLLLLLLLWSVLIRLLLIWNIFLCILPDSINQGRQVYKRILWLRRVLDYELYHIEILVFVFKAKVSKERSNEYLVCSLL